MELIDKQKAIEISSGYCHWSNIPKELEKLPTIDAVPMEVLYGIQAEVNKLYEEYRSKAMGFHADGLYERAYNLIDGAMADAFGMVIRIIYNHMCEVDE